MFIESNPVPLKKTLALWSAEALIPVPLWSAQVRAPLAELSEDHYKQLMITLNRWRGEQLS
jgi:hypothetical protein